MKVKSVGYKCMPGGNNTDRPILMEDGKVIDQDATVIEDKVIADGMRYVVKMTKGLATGVMSQDEEYIELQEKILKDLIEEQSFEIRKKIESESKQKIKQYAEAHKCHDRVLKEMYERSAALAKDNSINFFVNDEDQVYQFNSSSPVSMTTKLGGKWRHINLEELKANIEARQAKVAAAKEANKSHSEKIDCALDEFNKPADKKNSKAKKKTTKKKVTKKKISKKPIAKKRSK